MCPEYEQSESWGAVESLFPCFSQASNQTGREGGGSDSQRLHSTASLVSELGSGGSLDQLCAAIESELCLDEKRLADLQASIDRKREFLALIRLHSL